MKIAFGKPMIGDEEKQAVLNVLDGPILVHGTIAQEFEEAFARYCDSPYAISVSSCTAGMHLFYLSKGIGEGDEVIVPAQTHVATAHAVTLTGATPIFVDSDTLTGNIETASIESKITERTRAIAVVHYLGVPVDMLAIKALAEKHTLYVLEDCALGLGARYGGLHVGLLGDVGVFSFYPVKHITTAEGGMLIVRDKIIADKLRLLRAFGVDRTHGARKIPGMYDTVALGLNYRMSEVHAAIGLEQLKKLPQFLETRKRNFRRISEILKGNAAFEILPQVETNQVSSSYYCMGLVLYPEIMDRRSQIISRLAEKGVGTSIYYPHPVPRMTYYQSQMGTLPDDFPVASSLSDSMIAIPVGPHIDKEGCDFIGKAVLSAIYEVSPG